jgi:hypothetical protein
MINEESFYRRHEAESMVRDEGVVSDEPIGEVLVEEGEVGKDPRVSR